MQEQDRAAAAAARRESRRLALPLILAHLGVPALGMVDTAVVGHQPEPTALAAVALGSTLVSTLYFLFGFIRMGTTALTAQALGADRPHEIQAALARGFAAALLIGLGLLAAAPLVVAAAGPVLRPPPSVAPDFAAYVTIRLVGAPAALGQFALLGWFLGRQNARLPLIVTIATAGLNAVLSVVLVLGFGLGAAGVAIATVIAEHAGLGIALALAWPIWRSLAEPLRPAPWLARAPLVRLFRLNLDLFLRSVLLEAAFLVLQALSARQGETLLAANAVLMLFFTLAAYALDAFANAAEAMVGRAVGTGQPPAIRRAIAAAWQNGVVLALTLTLAFAACGPLLIRGVTGIEPVRAAALAHLPWALAIPLASLAAFIWDGVFFGATRTRALRDAMLMALGVYALAAWMLVPSLGNHGLWLSFLVFLLARGAILSLAWIRLGGSPGAVRAAADTP
jgi:MATE family multidrug resistance protein